MATALGIRLAPKQAKTLLHLRHLQTLLMLRIAWGNEGSRFCLFFLLRKAFCNVTPFPSPHSRSNFLPVAPAPLYHNFCLDVCPRGTEPSFCLSTPNTGQPVPDLALKLNKCFREGRERILGIEEEHTEMLNK